MKMNLFKIMWLSCFLSLPALSYATTIHIQGLENVSQASNFEINEQLYWGNCVGGTSFECKEQNFSSVLPMSIFNEYINAFNSDYQQIQLKKRVDQNSYISFHFSSDSGERYSGLCYVILSDKTNVNITFEKNGTCDVNFL